MLRHATTIGIINIVNLRPFWCLEVTSEPMYSPRKRSGLYFCFKIFESVLEAASEMGWKFHSSRISEVEFLFYSPTAVKFEIVINFFVWLKTCIDIWLVLLGYEVLQPLTC